MPKEANGNGISDVKYLPAEFYTPFLSEAANRRKPNPIRSLFPLENTPGLISLLAGKPNASCFPFKSISFKTRSPTDPSADVTLEVDKADLDRGLQYGMAAGDSSLVNWIFGLQEYFHGRKRGEGWHVSVGSGSQDMLYKAITAITNPGDSVLIESPAYAGVLPLLEHCELVEVASDSQGVNPASIRSIYENWPAEKPKPKALYTVPFGSNPTGATTSLERRKEILALAREHNFLIMEDDPYYYLYFGEAPRPPSYFNLELEEPEVGRVLRFDSLSKVLSAGIRVGFASGPEPLLHAMDMHTAVANLQAPGLVQVMVATLLNNWGYDTFKVHSQNVSNFYREKRDIFERAMRQHLTGLAEWSAPEAGMFYWFKLLLDPTGASEEDSEAVIRTKALERGVLALPGTVFMPNNRKTAYVRASFSLLDEQQIDEAIRRLRDVVLEARAASTAGKA
ncbi:PLP-dependent transferase [Gloeophyllum trabeum ATCC 11539]|uniref:PLP-dependent transferase n=1 Tax=Gloeophyllum trabeum (strain ATCC 11539 / FP-39264 / Madison 617) TaxID=670483 RepID=S7PYN1_GLOTA|nr:PLP-dependent transferase [Gloeophyllum trabeum ATCC 11539]EPQ52558.1 PLP-dependent transferase [Gloeophyllum trabeum ATCC 11539]